MRIEVELTREDMESARNIRGHKRALEFRSPVSVRILDVLSALAFVVAGLTIVHLLTSSQFDTVYFLLATSAFVGSSAYIWRQKIYAKSFYKHRDETGFEYPFRFQLCLEDGGVRIRTDEVDGIWAWSYFDSMEESPAQILLLAHRPGSVVIPVRAFADDAQKEKFLIHVRQRIVA